MIRCELERRSSVLPGLTALAGLIGRHRRPRPGRPLATRNEWLPLPHRPMSGERIDAPLYRLVVDCRSRAVAEKALALLSRELDAADLAAQHVFRKTQSASGVTRLTVDIRCDAPRRVHLARFVRQMGDTAGVSSVRWMTRPSADHGAR
ncbi:hypothetical protein ABC977_12150 [Thioalkalicoccus limnaeus]|uniref:ACT domain-containing protein n=1 Tax=Thioalkalicoccus limnaeus TaxID=120681 RepID=A0ABV4BF46_9GAMM